MSFIFVFFASLMNALMDLLDHETMACRGAGRGNRFFVWMIGDWSSKYVHSDPAQGLKKILGMPLPSFCWNGWYAAKTLMLLFFFLAIVSCQHFGIWNVFWMMLIWTCGFEFGYGYVFRKPELRSFYFKRFWIW